MWATMTPQALQSLYAEAIDCIGMRTSDFYIGAE
jgi:hypothetical protein